MVGSGGKGSHQFQSPAMAQAPNGSAAAAVAAAAALSVHPGCDAHRPSCSQVVFGKGLPVGQGCRSQRWHIGARHWASFRCRSCEFVTRYQAKVEMHARQDVTCSCRSECCRRLPPCAAAVLSTTQARTEAAPSRIACRSPLCHQQVTQTSTGWLMGHSQGTVSAVGDRRLATHANRHGWPCHLRIILIWAIEQCCRVLFGRTCPGVNESRSPVKGNSGATLGWRRSVPADPAHLRLPLSLGVIRHRGEAGGLTAGHRELARAP